MHNTLALALPFVITAVDKNSFDVSCEHLASRIIGDSPSKEDVEALRPLSDRLAAALGDWTPEAALKEACESMAERGMEHKDIEWRHVGLLPCFPPAPELGPTTPMTLRPVLIDLEMVEEIDPTKAPEDAAQAFLDRERQAEVSATV